MQHQFFCTKLRFVQSGNYNFSIYKKEENKMTKHEEEKLIDLEELDRYCMTDTPGAVVSCSVELDNSKRLKIAKMASGAINLYEYSKEDDDFIFLCWYPKKKIPEITELIKKQEYTQAAIRLYQFHHNR